MAIPLQKNPLLQHSIKRLTMDANQTICVKYKWHYWLIYLFVMPMAGLMGTAIIYGILKDLFAIDAPKQYFIPTWIAISVLITLWTLSKDLNKYFYLHNDHIQIGIGFKIKRVFFHEIESIVIGLPEHTPWWYRLIRFWPLTRPHYKSMMTTRSNTLLLRLPYKKYYPLCLAFSYFTNGDKFYEQFLELNESKIVGHETYSAIEIKSLTMIRLNKFLTITGGKSV